MRTRREFIFASCNTVASLALVPLGLAGTRGAAAGEFQSLDQINYPDLAGQVGTSFRVRLSTRRVVELKLIKAPLAPPTRVQPSRRPPGDAANEKFSLIFTGRKDEIIESAIHQFEHNDLGRFEMYIGQRGSQEAGYFRYEAVFNRPATRA